jgi:agmatine/peptidylarginine deiminase
MRRLIAEWERQKALLVVYPHNKGDWGKYFYEITSFYDEFISIVKNYQEVVVIKEQTNDTWIRDFGPITIIKDKKLKLLDFTFNGWGLKYSANFDNGLNRKLFNTKKIGFVLEGGSIDTNGEGVLLTTKSCLLEANRNPHLTQKEIEEYLKNIFGLKKIIWLENGFLEGDDTDGHIDMLARFVNKDTIAYITCDDRDDVHYDMLKKMEEELKRSTFNLVPLPWVSAKYFNNQRLPASYANFVIINNAVIVPTYNDTNDKEALKIFSTLFKDRDVIGLDASVLIREKGSIHCCCMNLYEGEI